MSRIHNLTTEITERIQQKRQNVDDYLEEHDIDNPSPLTYPADYFNHLECDEIVGLENPSSLSRKLSGTAYTLKITSKLLLAVGHTYLKRPDAGVGASFVGHGEVKVKQNTPAMIGSLLDGGADVLLAASNAYQNKVRYCVSLQAQLNILEKLESM